jgi:hypothetical protein
MHTRVPLLITSSFVPGGVAPSANDVQPASCQQKTDRHGLGFDPHAGAEDVRAAKKARLEREQSEKARPRNGHGHAFGVGALEEPEDEEVLAHTNENLSFEVVEPTDEEAEPRQSACKQRKRLREQRKQQLKREPHVDQSTVSSLFKPQSEGREGRHQRYQLPKVLVRAAARKLQSSVHRFNALARCNLSSAGPKRKLDCTTRALTQADGRL